MRRHCCFPPRASQRRQLHREMMAESPHPMDTDTTLDPAEVDSMYEAHRQWKTTAYPNYSLPYRGLPTEIRMEIWRHAFTRELEVEPLEALRPGHDTSDEDDREEEHWMLTSTSPWIKWETIRNQDDFNLSIFLLKKEVRAEAVALTKDTVTWKFGWDMWPSSAQKFLRSFTPCLRHITRGVSLATTTLEGKHDDCDRWATMIISFRDVIGYNRFAEMTFRLSLKASGDSPGSLFVPVNDDPNVQASHHLLAWGLDANNWNGEVVFTVYGLLTTGQVSCVRIEHNKAYEGLRSFFGSPLAALFGNSSTGRHLSRAEVDTLNVQLDWPVGSNKMVISITKKVANFR